MQLNLEHREKYSINGYTQNSISIGDAEFRHSIFLCAEDCLPLDKNPDDLEQLPQAALQWLLQKEILLIGSDCIALSKIRCWQTPTALSSHAIGIECMTLGAACRTFNVLINEHRAIAALLLI